MSRRVLRISSIINSKQDYFNRYIPGSGVGATNASVRRAKLIKATRTSYLPPLPPVPPPPPSLCGSIQFTNLSNPTSVDYPNDNTLVIGTNDFTIEWWQYWTEESPFARVFSIGSYGDDISIAISYESNNIYFWYDNSPMLLLDQATPKNVWTHIAIVGVEGTEIKLYIDGTLITTEPLSYDFTEGVLPLTIGNENTLSSDANFTGKITNFRWVVGSQVYTTNFIPPTNPLLNIPGTRLLLLVSGESNTLTDSSNYNRIPTNYGTTYSTLTPITCSPPDSKIYSKDNITPGVFTIGDNNIQKDMDIDFYDYPFGNEENPYVPSDYSDLFPNMAELSDENIVEGYKGEEQRLYACYWLDVKYDIFDGWGFFYIYDVESEKYYFPLLEPLNENDGVIIEQTFIAFGGRTFTIKHGWTVSGIFKFDISVNDDLPFRFGCYGDIGSDAKEYVENLIYNYTLGDNKLKLYYHLDKEENSTTKILYSYWIPKKVSENNNIQSYNIYYKHIDNNSNALMSAISKPVTNGLIVYFSILNDVKQWVVNDLALE